MLSIQGDEHYMKQALNQAHLGEESNEVPVGAIITAKGKVIAKAYNQVERLKDVTAHAEMIALTSAQNYLGSKYLVDCKMYVTLEPCVMCAGALYWSQIGEIIIGARDEKRGFSLQSQPVLHPKTKVKWGVLEEESSSLLSSFFDKMRRNNL